MTLQSVLIWKTQSTSGAEKGHDGAGDTRRLLQVNVIAQIKLIFLTLEGKTQYEITCLILLFFNGFLGTNYNPLRLHVCRRPIILCRCARGLLD